MCVYDYVYVHTARKLATVGTLNGTSVLSYSGFLTVNKTFNGNMFFWFFPSQVNVIDRFYVVLLLFYNVTVLKFLFMVGFGSFLCKNRSFGSGLVDLNGHP